MTQAETFTITITHMFGSGGAEIGQQLAKKLDILYLDRQIVKEAAEKLDLSETEVEQHDEKRDSLWDTIFRAAGIMNESGAMAPSFFVPSDRLVFESQMKIIEHAAKEHSTVILGRGASHILRNYSRHISVFLHGGMDFRKDRIKQIYDLNDREALKMIEENDKKRCQYYKLFTGCEISDSSQYTMCLDTSKIGIKESIEIILGQAERKFGVTRINP